MARISLSPDAIRAARGRLVVVTGVRKAGLVRIALEGELAPSVRHGRVTPAGKFMRDTYPYFRSSSYVGDRFALDALGSGDLGGPIQHHVIDRRHVPTVSLGPKVRVGAGASIGAHALVDAGAQLGKGARVMGGSYVPPGTEIADGESFTGEAKGP